MNTFPPRPTLLALPLLILLFLLPRPVMSAPSVSQFEQRCERVPGRDCQRDGQQFLAARPGV